jgi:hypothetical protein
MKPSSGCVSKVAVHLLHADKTVLKSSLNNSIELFNVCVILNSPVLSKPCKGQLLQYVVDAP